MTEKSLINSAQGEGGSITKVFRIVPAEVNLEGNVGSARLEGGKEHSRKRKHYVHTKAGKPPRTLRTSRWLSVAQRWKILQQTRLQRGPGQVTGNLIY